MKTLDMPRLGTRRFASGSLPLALLICSVALSAGSAAFFLLSAGAAGSQSVSYGVGFQGCATVGAFLAWKRPANPIGWILCAIALLNSLWSFAVQYATFALVVRPGSVPAGSLALWLSSSWLGDIAWTLMIVFLPLLFPTGRLVTPRWRFVGWAAALALVLVVTAEMARLGPVLATGPLASFPNPFGVHLGPAWTAAALVASNALLLLMLAAGASLVLRFRRSVGEERLQMKWFVYAASLLPPLFLAALVSNASGFEFLNDWVVVPGSALAVLALPAAIGVAVVKFRLYGIDEIINRTLVYGGLTTGIAGGYVLIVGTLGSLFDRQNDILVPLIATTLVAVVFHPARERLQRGVNRWMYGQRDEPYTVLSTLNQRLALTLEPHEILPSIASTLRSALKLPYVAIETGEGVSAQIVATSGQPSVRLLRVPLTYQREAVGSLLLAPRSANESFSTEDLVLIHDLAQQVAVTVRAVSLTAELQRSREELVTAREEERRRIRRDLHDGLGPTLAAMSLQVGALRRLMKNDAEGAETIVTELKNEIRSAIGDIRRLVYDLRPPSLDELGLLGAIRAKATEFGASVEGNELRVTVEAPDALPTLSAAVEVAAYRIVLEALTNIAKHAQAGRCDVVITLDSHLRIRVVDDGIGCPEDREGGVGLRSMRERAEELGGTFELEASPGAGTQVRVSIPLRGEP